MDMMESRNGAGFEMDLSSADYLTVLSRFHAFLNPKTYLEIGTRSGDSLKLAKCASVAIDPQFGINSDAIGAKPSCHFYQVPSDRYFTDIHNQAVLGGPVELAYLDGMHLSEFLLRDFMNVERVCRRNSVIVMHDCMPSDVRMACRFEGHPMRLQSRYPDWWTGDVWKTVWALKKHRPDLSVVSIASPPTGLICITNLDPDSRVLAQGYNGIVKDMAALEDTEEVLQSYLRDLSSIKPDRIATFETMSEYFYL